MDKPNKPTKDFPLYAHGRGHWAKKIKGKTLYFGRWEDPDSALENYHLHLKQMALEAEQAEREKQTLAERRESGGITVGEIWTEYIDYNRRRVESGDIAPTTLADYRYVANTIKEQLKPSTKVAELSPQIFADLRLTLVHKYSPSRASKLVTVTRQVFNWAYESELMEKPVRFGPGFRVVSQKQRRVHKANSAKKLLGADQIRALYDAADEKWKLLILLGINCAFGNTDIAKLKQSHIHLREGWLGDLFESSPINKISFIAYPRSKTGIERRIPLWDITKLRMERYIEANPPDESGLIFTTKQGLPMIRHSSNGAKTDSTVESFRRLRKRAGVENAGFYWLRHTFQTVAEDIKDLPAIAAVMGHADSTMAAQYREEVRPERIIEVVKYVSKWNTAGNGFEESL